MLGSGQNGIGEGSQIPFRTSTLDLRDDGRQQEPQIEDADTQPDPGLNVRTRHTPFSFHLNAACRGSRVYPDSRFGSVHVRSDTRYCAFYISYRLDADFSSELSAHNLGIWRERKLLAGWECQEIRAFHQPKANGTGWVARGAWRCA
jgi:hypothetical protein